ncbi:hypothetical protein Pst134EB_022082 [Puccinia striiformis f. sp. tritici]|nr:hypothetical protein Pst134EB_022082 [Puccinia striiformis f. sp. tritici]
MAFEEFGQIEECTLIQKYQHREIQVSAVIHFASIGQAVHATSVMDGVTADGISLQVAIIPEGGNAADAALTSSRHEALSTAWRGSSSSGSDSDELELLQAVENASRRPGGSYSLSESFADKLELLQAVENASRPPGGSPGRRKCFMTAWRLLQLVGKLRRQAGASPGRQKRFPTAWRLSRPLKRFLKAWRLSRPSKTIPEGLEALQAFESAS